MSETVPLAARVSKQTWEGLQERLHKSDFSNFSEMLRAILDHYVMADEQDLESVTTRMQQRVNPQRDNSCPLLSLARSELCRRCPYREQPVTSRESALPEIPSSCKGPEDTVGRMIEELFTQGKKKI